MSAADEAYREWSTHPQFNTWVSVENAFIEGYRRALEDAADNKARLQRIRTGIKKLMTPERHTDTHGFNCAGCLQLGLLELLRTEFGDDDVPTAVAPRETKD